MPNALTGPPNTYDFGEGFNYNLWTADTNISITNVNWNNDYRDICQFPTALGLSIDQWIDSQEVAPVDFPNVSYIKINRGQVVLNIPFNKAMRFNYMRVSNPVQPIPGSDFAKSYYYFILDVQEISPNTTLFTLQLDVWNSFQGEFTFGHCYLEKGHYGIANENAFNNFGRDYLTVPEGLDIGSEYQTITKANKSLFGTNPSILVASAVDLTGDPGDETNPHLHAAIGSIFQGLPSGATYYLWYDYATFGVAMGALSSTPWVTQGFLNITMIPDITKYYPGFTFSNEFGPGTKQGAEIAPTAKPPALQYDMLDAWRDSEAIADYLGERYAHLKKFLTAPYCVVEFTAFTGNPIILKPESWANENATVMERVSLVPPNQRIELHPFGYNSLPGVSRDGGVGSDDNGDYLDVGTVVGNFPTMAIVNDGAVSYLASNFANIGFQRTNADWTQQRALRGNEVTYDQNKRGISTNKNINAIGRSGTSAGAASANEQLMQATAANGLGGDIIALAGAAGGGAQSGAGAGAGGIGLGGPISAVGNQIMGGINAGIQSGTNTRNANIANMVNQGQTAGANAQSVYINDTNKSLADWSAKGDYENTIAGVNAMVQGASMIQPSVSGQTGGEAINIINNSMELSVRIKMIDKASIARIGDYWLRYGYAINRFITFPDTFSVMSKFTYWKLQETYINSATMPEGFKQIIRGIFEKGVTVWTDPSYIGNTDLADNTANEGIAF